MKQTTEHEKDCPCPGCLWDRFGGNKPIQPTRVMVSPKQYDLIEKHGFTEGMIKSLTTKDK